MNQLKMSKVKHFQVKPEHVEAIQFEGKNGQDIADWIGLFSDRYGVSVSYTAEYMLIEQKDSNTWWKANIGDWVVRSFINQYFYVETSAIMDDQYIKL